MKCTMHVPALDMAWTGCCSFPGGSGISFFTVSNPSPILKCQALNCHHPCLRLWGSVGQCQEGASAWCTTEHQKSNMKHKKLKAGENKTQNMPLSLYKSIRDDRLEEGKHITIKTEFFVSS